MEKFGMNKHADKVKVSNKTPNITRARSENLVNYITWFERIYAEEKKLGETLSQTCLPILPIKQAQLTDSQISKMNSEFNPMADTAEQNLESCGANMKKFHSKLPRLSP